MYSVVLTFIIRSKVFFQIVGETCAERKRLRWTMDADKTKEKRPKECRKIACHPYDPILNHKIQRAFLWKWKLIIKCSLWNCTVFALLCTALFWLLLSAVKCLCHRFDDSPISIVGILLTPAFIYPFWRNYSFNSALVQELCESRDGRPGLSVLTSLLVSVDVKNYWTVLRHWSQLVPNNYVNWHLRTLSNTSSSSSTRP